MPRIILTSFTPLDAPGGVPRFNRDFVSAFPSGSVVHYSAQDVPDLQWSQQFVPEWVQAEILARYLRSKKLVTEEDIVVGDGFWAEGYWPHRTVSHSHGIWSHLTKEDVLLGMQPEFPYHHAAQLSHRRRHLENGGKLTAVSEFIADSMKRQWDFEAVVINNGIDLERFRPMTKLEREKPLIIHGVHNRDFNKGWDHVKAVQDNVDAMVVLYDDAVQLFPGLTKEQVLAQADLVLIPSAHEGNSYFCLEALASGVPVAGYNVGLMYEAFWKGTMEKDYPCPGAIVHRASRSQDCTVRSVELAFEDGYYEPRRFAEMFSLEKFRQDWRDYMKREFSFDPSQG